MAEQSKATQVEDNSLFEMLFFSKNDEGQCRRYFSPNEDQTILQFIKRCETEKEEPDWEFIAAAHDRTARQIKERYDNLMSKVPVIWTPVEIQVALMIEHVHGRIFRLLVQSLPNKSWYHICRKLNDAKALQRKSNFAAEFKRAMNTKEYLPYLDNSLIIQLWLTQSS